MSPAKMQTIRGSKLHAGARRPNTITTSFGGGGARDNAPRRTAWWMGAPHRLPGSRSVPAPYADAGATAAPERRHLAQRSTRERAVEDLRTSLPDPLDSAKSGANRYVVAPYQILSWWPRIVLYPGFVSHTEADHIRELAMPRMEESLIIQHNGSRMTDRVRKSSSAFIKNAEDSTGFLGQLEHRIAETLLIPVNHGETFHVLRYEKDQLYEAHMDTFNPDKYGPQKSQRMATMIIYLTDVEEGGETVFKLEGEEEINDARWRTFNQSTCEDSEFKYKPKKGDAVVFYSLDHDNTINYRSMHGGCPVKRGEKWVLTKWIHNKVFVRPDLPS